MKAALHKLSRPRRDAGQRHSIRRRARRKAASEGPPIQRAADLATQRAREAGGPVDQAHYSCPCGCAFVARVSTTVECPHCEAPQAW